MERPWQPIEQMIREILAEKDQPITEESIQQVGMIFVAHLMAGRDFRVSLEETIDDILYRTESYGGIANLIVV